MNSAVENVYFVCEEESITGAPAKIGELGVDKWGRIGVSALLILVAHMASEPAFDQLRTKEQLGYIVYTTTVKFGNFLGIRLIVQSNSKDGDFLDQRIENFLATYRDTLATISPEDLASNIQV